MTPARWIPRSPRLHGFVDRSRRPAPRCSGRHARADLAKAAERFHALRQRRIGRWLQRDADGGVRVGRGDGPIAVAKRQMSMRHRQWLSHNEGRLQLRRRFETFFASYDILLLPVMPCVAIRHDHTEPISGRTVSTEAGPRPYWELNRWMAPAGACYLPATVVPVGSPSPAYPSGCRSSGRTSTTGPRWRSPPRPRPWSAPARPHRTTPADVARGCEPPRAPLSASVGRGERAHRFHWCAQAGRSSGRLRAESLATETARMAYAECIEVEHDGP